MFLAGFCLGCITIIFLSVWKDSRHRTLGKLFMALLVSAAAFVVHDYLPESWRWLAGDIMTALPGLFWAICVLGFTAIPSEHKSLLPVAIYSFVAPALSRPFGANDESIGLAHYIFWDLPQYCEYVVICGGVYAVISGWSGDLVEERRKLRALVLYVLGITALVVTVHLNFGMGRDIPFYAVALCCVICAYIMLEPRSGSFNIYRARQAQSKQEKPANEPVSEIANEAADEHSKLAMALGYLMESGFYRNENLTLRRLAIRLDAPEHRLRKLINERFGYRNFSDYINQLRIEDASERLLREQDTPIQNIALDVGYRSLSSFNRAFKQNQNCTPTEFRANNSGK